MATENAYIGSPDNPRTAAVVAYITFIGWLIAYFGLYKKHRTHFTALHLRQSLPIHIISFILKALFSFNNPPVIWIDVAVAILALGLFGLWLTGFLYALNGKEKYIPLLGRFSNQIFNGL